MRKTMHKWFWVWDFDKEEKWLNEMAAKGLALVATGFCRYEFEECAPGEYKVCLGFLESNHRAENEQFLRFLEETGAEHVGTFGRWVYLRKKGDGSFGLYSDLSSRVQFLTNVIRFIALVAGMNLYFGFYNLYLLLIWGNALSYAFVVSFTVAVLAGFGLWKLLQKRKRLKTEQQIFE